MLQEEGLRGRAWQRLCAAWVCVRMAAGCAWRADTRRPSVSSNTRKHTHRGRQQTALARTLRAPFSSPVADPPLCASMIAVNPARTARQVHRGG